MRKKIVNAPINRRSTLSSSSSTTGYLFRTVGLPALSVYVVFSLIQSATNTNNYYYYTDPSKSLLNLADETINQSNNKKGGTKPRNKMNINSNVNNRYDDDDGQNRNLYPTDSGDDDDDDNDDSTDDEVPQDFNQLAANLLVQVQERNHQEMMKQQQQQQQRHVHDDNVQDLIDMSDQEINLNQNYLDPLKTNEQNTDNKPVRVAVVEDPIPATPENIAERIKQVEKELQDAVPTEQPFNSSYVLPAPYPTQSTTVILVLSAQFHFQRRQGIRETWKRGHDNVYFVVARSNCMESSGEVMNTKSDPYIREGDPHHECITEDHTFLRNEQERYHDLIEVPHMREYYRGLPEKVVTGYKWVLEQYPHVQWIAKADDDLFVRVASLEHYLIKYNSQIPMVIGKINERAPVARGGKWAEINFRQSHYPYWAQGSCGHVVSKPTAAYVTKPDLFRYQGEDVSIGIWLDESPLDVTWIHAPNLFTNQGVQHCDGSNPLSSPIRAGGNAGRPTNAYFMVGHDLSVQQMARCYTLSDEVPMEHAWVDSRSGYKQHYNKKHKNNHINHEGVTHKSGHTVDDTRRSAQVQNSQHGESSNHLPRTIHRMANVSKIRHGRKHKEQ